MGLVYVPDMFYCSRGGGRRSPKPRAVSQEPDMSALPATAAMADRLQAAPRCHGRSKRTRLPCRAPAVRGFAVCRFHGARGGAPRGNRNAWKHGVRGGAWRAQAAGLRALVREARRLVCATKTRVHGVVRSDCAGGPPPAPSRVRSSPPFGLHGDGGGCGRPPSLALRRMQTGCLNSFAALYDVDRVTPRSLHLGRRGRRGSRSRRACLRPCRG